MTDAFIQEKLDVFRQSNRIPHTIFHGPSTCEKESIVMNFLKKIYVRENDMRENVMFVNCAHGKGIKFIREEIKFFAKTNVQPGISFKSVVLLNADHLTLDAQSALRRCIEQFSNHTRFFILVENKNKLLTPILSRFCEIHIAHSSQPKVNVEQIREVDQIMKSFMNESNNSMDYIRIVACVNALYESALCCLDIVEWSREQPYWTPLQKANFGMCYAKLKPEYRSEKILMTVILSILYTDPNVDLKNMSFM